MPETPAEGIFRLPGIVEMTVLVEPLRRLAERIPVLGRIVKIVVLVLTALKLLPDSSPQPISEDEKKQRRKTRRENQARYVLKASDAMECVEESLYGEGGGLVIALGKAIAAGHGVSVPDLISDEVYTCIESKVLSQTGKRKKKEKKYYGRPARGHGKGLQKKLR